MRKNYALMESGWIPGHEDAFKPNAVGKIRLYDMGGGGGQPQQSTTYTTNLPEYAKPYYTGMLERSEALTQEGYQPYTGQRIAGFTPQQQAAFQETMGMQTPGQFGQATGATQAAMQSALGTQYGPGQFNVQGVTPERAGAAAFDQSALQQYMSPFQQNITDIAKRNAALEAQKIQQASNLGAARTGTYGGARQTLAQTEREKALMQNLSDIQMKGSQAAFENAQQQFERDQARRMAAQQLNVQSGLQADLATQQQMMEAQRAAEQSRQFGATTGLEGLRLGLAGAQQLAGVGAQQQAADLARMQSQQAVAGSEQQLQQKRLDQAYQDFLSQREFPYRQLEFYNAMLRGLPVQANTTSTQYQAPPTLAQQAIGYGIPALALSKAFGAA